MKPNTATSLTALACGALAAFTATALAPGHSEAAKPGLTEPLSRVRAVDFAWEASLPVDTVRFITAASEDSFIVHACAQSLVDTYTIGVERMKPGESTWTTVLEEHADLGSASPAKCMEVGGEPGDVVRVYVDWAGISSGRATVSMTTTPS